MLLTQDEKNHVLKTFTSFLKKVNGKGPRNIYLKLYDEEIHIVMEGVISDFEKYLIQNFGKEAIDTFNDFYQRDCINAEKEFQNMLPIKKTFKFIQLDANFIEDHFTYKMRVT